MRTALVLSVLALAIAAAGCGGGDDKSSTADPAATWAASFCGAITDWKTQLDDIGSRFSDASNFSQEAIQTSAEDAQSATQSLVDDLRDLGGPDTASRQQVEDAVDGLSTTLDDESAKIQETADGIGGLTGLPSAIATITASLSAMAAAFSQTYDTVREADADGELRTAFDENPTCTDLTTR